MSPIRPTISSCGADGCLIPPHKGFNYSPRLIDESTEPRPGGGGGRRGSPVVRRVSGDTPMGLKGSFYLFLLSEKWFVLFPMHVPLGDTCTTQPTLRHLCLYIS